MKQNKKHFIALVTALLTLANPGWSLSQEFVSLNPQQLLEKSDEVMRGKISHEMHISMDVKRGERDYQYELKVWMKGEDQTFARTLSPAKVEGQGFLRLKARLWQYLPKAERTLLIPPSLMLDRFMGSDFANDDLVKMSYFPRDYNAKILKEETLNAIETVHMELIPHPDAPVTYGKLEMWVRKHDGAPVRIDFYDEHLVLIRKLHYSEYKSFGGHEIPTVWRMENIQEPNRATVIKVLDAAFDKPVEDSLFTRENLEVIS